MKRRLIILIMTLLAAAAITACSKGEAGEPAAISSESGVVTVFKSPT